MIWLFLVVFALAGAAIFAGNVFFDWQGERTITSLKTISKPVNELDFPSVTICKDGQNMQAVREALETEKDEWAEIIRKKRPSEQPSGEGFDYCQLLFHRDCEQVVYSYLRTCIIVWFPVHKVVEIVRALASRDIERSIKSSALHFYSSLCELTAHSEGKEL